VIVEPVRETATDDPNAWLHRTAARLVTSVLVEHHRDRSEAPSVIQFEHQTVGNHEAGRNLSQLITTTPTDRLLCTLPSAEYFQYASDVQEINTSNNTQLLACVISILSGNRGMCS
jgi:hypothetical protein